MVVEISLQNSVTSFWLFWFLVFEISGLINAAGFLQGDIFWSA